MAGQAGLENVQVFRIVVHDKDLGRVFSMLNPSASLSDRLLLRRKFARLLVPNLPLGPLLNQL